MEEKDIPFNVKLIKSGEIYICTVHCDALEHSRIVSRNIKDISSCLINLFEETKIDFSSIEI